MKIKNILLEKSILVIIMTCLSFSSAQVNASIFKSIKKTSNGIVNEAGDVVDDAIDEGGELANDAEKTANNKARKTISQANNITRNLNKVVMNSAGDLLDSAGNIINEADLRDYANSLLDIDPLTGIASIKRPFESSMMFNVALRNGAWKSISDAIKQETVFIGLNSGASLLQIRDQLANFDSQVQTAFAGSSEFILDTAASAQLGKGLNLIRGAFAQCAGSVNKIDDCFEDFINQFISFYRYIRHYIAKVTELKSYSKGEKFDALIEKISAIERKSVKYFLPILENSTDNLNFSTASRSFSQSTSVQSGFEAYSSIADIRNSLEVSNYSYHNDPQRACSRVSLPIICDSFEDLNNVAINRFNYKESGISGSEAAHRKRVFNAIAIKSFGSGYTDTKSGNSSTKDKKDVIHYLRSELYKDINWSQIQDQRIPYIVKNELLGGAGGAFIATETDSIILLNEELFTDDTSLDEGFGSDDIFYARKVALEELGHWLNWRRCQFRDDMNNCASEGDTFGDSGAKFATASFIEYVNFTDFVNQLQEVSEGLWSQPTQLTLSSGQTATYEGNPSLTDIQTALDKQDAKIRFRMRTQIGTPSSALNIGDLGSSGIIEINYTPPKRIKASSLDDMNRYDYEDPDRTLFLGKIDIVFALENYIGASTGLLTDALFLPKLYGEVGLKSSIGISIPLLKERLSSNNLKHLNREYRDTNIGLSYSVSPYVFSYLSLISVGTNTKASLDLTSAVWWGISTAWPAKSNTVPFSITMAGITVGSTGIGCIKGTAVLTSMGVPISTQLKCALGAQLASGVLVSGTGALASLSNNNVSFDHSSGWVNGVRVKFSDSTTGLAVETRFEALFSDWRMGVDQLTSFGQRTKNIFSKDKNGNSNELSSLKQGSQNLVDQNSTQNTVSNGNMKNLSSTRIPDNSLTFANDELILFAGESITTQNRRLIMQKDGNLVLYKVNNGTLGRSLWATNTKGSHYKVRFQGDGNLVIYHENGNAIWATGTNPQGNTLELQEDGDLIIYSHTGSALWSTQTYE